MNEGTKSITPEELEAAARLRKAKEAKLVALLKERQPGAVNMLYSNYSRALYGTITRIVRNEAVAEDLLQETFIKVWQNMGQYDAARSSFFTWMLNIARHLAIDYLRSAQHQQSLRCTEMEPRNSFGKDQQTLVNTEHMGIKALTCALKPDQKRVIDLLYFGGYTHTEAAEELGLPLGTVKTHARAALKVLAKLI